ncbi:unnamed protein product [Allacma fusca]|uniref:Uncharacterized protein n=1 Tax=Allacma fusca TaxID=39272 RepID=A0A8J2PBM4_9HEXA|nr:unnamed protein product [Allacma fusca]
MLGRRCGDVELETSKNMDYGSRRIYTVADSRLPVYCTYSTRPDGLGSAPLSLISAPQTRIIQCNAGDSYGTTSRVVVVPSRLRRVYAGLEPDEDEDDIEPFVPSYKTRLLPSTRHSYIDDICNSPQMDEIELETRKIKRDAQAVLHRLGQSYKKKPSMLSSVYCPDLTYTGSTYIPGTYSSIRTSIDRDMTPDVDDSYYRPRRTNTYASTRILHDPIAQVQSEINRKAIYSENCRKINDSVRGAVRRKKESDTDTVKNNINFRAQYASLRAAANVGLRKANDYLMVHLITIHRIVFSSMLLTIKLSEGYAVITFWQRAVNLKEYGRVLFIHFYPALALKSDLNA